LSEVIIIIILIIIIIIIIIINNNNKKVQMFHWGYSNAKAFNKVQSQRPSALTVFT